MPDILKPAGMNNRWAQNGLKSEPDLSKIDVGWEVEKPPFQVQNWQVNKTDNFNAHVNQHGIPYKDNETEYQAGKSYVVDQLSGIVYRCVTTHVNQPVTNPTYWDVAFSPYEAMVPTGSTQMFAGTSAPRGWLIADGSAVSRTTYAALFSVIGTTYGAGNGSTTFNLPDLRGVVVRGVDRGRNLDPGRAQGSYQGDLLASHTHNNTATSAASGEHTHVNSVSQEGGHNHAFSGTTSTDGEHRHGTSWGERGPTPRHGIYNSTWGVGSKDSDQDNPEWATSTDGQHNHTFSGTTVSQGIHTHAVTSAAAGQHTHTITMNNASTGGTETRMKNIALLGIIKF